MKVSLNWLKDYVDIEDLSPSELAEILTRGGVEVEGIVNLSSTIEGVVVGEVVSILPHPQADRLTLCQVKGGNSSLSIVCGAKNMKVGDKVALAPSGARLPNDFRIERVKIRGEWSYGMMCSEVELGLGEDASGIMILPDELKVGENLVTALRLDDHILELNVTPNRPDWLSIIGIAREVAALTNRRIRLPEVKVIEEGEKIGKLTSVTVEAPDLCWRYAGRVISGMKILPSPFWMRRRLESLDVRSINNAVDVTNYCLLEWGQPLHAFDFNLLEGKRIVVKRASPGERFTTLDKVERILDPDTLMICDGIKSIALAGIMGGLNTEVREDTVDLFLESALFNPRSIRKTSKRLGLSTESSQRFEKGVDPQGVIHALNRAAQLICQLGGGKVAQGYLDLSSAYVPLPSRISLTVKRVSHILGTTIEREEMKSCLERLGLNPVKGEQQDMFEVVSPSFRMDLKQPIDVIEEIARIYGYDRIPSRVPSHTLSFKGRPSFQIFEEKVKRVMRTQGFNEVITYSFISPREIEALNLPSSDPRTQALEILNPLSEAQSVMRTTLIPGLLSTMRRNIYQKNYDLKIFEMGRVFIRKEEGHLPAEKRMLAGLITGLRSGEVWNIPKEDADFYDIKGCLEGMLEELNIQRFQFLRPPNVPYLHPGKSCSLFIGDENIGILGEVYPDLLSYYDLDKRAVIFEINLDSLQQFSERLRYYKPLSKYPPVYRDIALIIREEMSAEEVKSALMGLNIDLVEEVSLFDFYQGKPIPEGEKGLAYRIKYQAYDRTLTDEEVNLVHGKITSFLRQELGVEIR
jgi:phenylalanyl-tRNA synthetase beta chain